MRKSARELFASALETPGGLKVQTIHALCTRLLQQFPFEAKVPARFTVLDDRDQTEMMERASLSVMLDASRAPDSALGGALRTAMASAADVTFKEVVREACLSRDHFMAWANAAGSAEAATRQASSALGVSEHDRIDDIEREIVDGPNLPRARWEEFARVLETGARTEQDHADRLRAALVATDALQVDTYLGLFLTETERTPRKTLVTANFRQAQSRPRQADRRRRQASRAADRETPRGHRPRPHRSAVAHRDCGVGKLLSAKSWSADCSTMTI
jgi:ATP-dependent helicase/nuclease subunit A